MGSTPVYRRSNGHFVRYLIIIVVVIALVIVGINLAHKSSTATPSAANLPAQTTWKVAPPSLTEAMTKLPASVFNAIGTTSKTDPVTGLETITSGGKQPILTGTSSTGVKLPEVFYVGADYCPFCAAERWSTIIALSRFGTFSNLGLTASGATDIYPKTQTFTFSKSTYISKYVSFVPVEQFTNIKSGNGYTPLETLTPAENAVFQKYDTANGDDIPFISFGDQFFQSGSSYSPQALAGLTRKTIADALGNPSNPVTAAIVATANYQVAAICSLTKQQPSKVCDAKGTKAADEIMKIK
jgi:hypothetical protein